PGFDGYFSQNNGDFRVKISLNRHGHRNPEPPENADGRIWVIGDSMTFGWGVKHTEMYSKVLENLLSMPVYNLASPGTDICGYQSMVARMPENAKPRVVIVGLVLENDVREYDCRSEAKDSYSGNRKNPEERSGISLLEVKQFATQNSALYNFFAVSLKRVAFVQRFLVNLGMLQKPHSVNRSIAPETLPGLAASTVRELSRLRTMLPAETPFIALVVPTRFEIRDDTPIFAELRRAVTRQLRKNKISIVDPLPAFKREGFGTTHFKHDGHWSALGHKIAAYALADRLLPAEQTIRDDHLTGFR
ncbi:MAG: hypothetical protein VX007_10275, partial [Pseudomonadota bacterium]|nr:hypothetical protein [Pseudomonadota bacterium]